MGDPVRSNGTSCNHGGQFPGVQRRVARAIRPARFRPDGSAGRITGLRRAR